MSEKMNDKIGYFLLANTKETPKTALIAGQKIRNESDGPPYMIVDKEIQSLILATQSWLGRLWRARVVKLGDMSGLIKNVHYWRASEIELIEELPVGLLFGENGDKIVPLLEQISTITLTDADRLQNAEISSAEVAYAHGWEIWNKGLEHPRKHKYSDGMTIGSPSNHDKQMSPINYGFSLIHSLIWKHAGEIEGEAAFVEYIEYDQTERELNPRWQAACTAFMCKAMATGMSRHLSAEEKAALTQPWQSVFGKNDTSVNK